MSPGNNITCCSRDKKEIKCEHQVVLFNSDNSLARQGLSPFLQEKKLILTVVQKPVHNRMTSELCRSQVWLQSLCSCPSAHCCLLCSLLSYSLLELNYEQDSGWGTVLGNTSAWKQGCYWLCNTLNLGGDGGLPGSARDWVLRHLLCFPAHWCLVFSCRAAGVGRCRGWTALRHLCWTPEQFWHQH